MKNRDRRRCEILTEDYIKYASRNVLVKWRITRFLDTIKGLIHATNAHSILDVGCGQGFATISLLKSLPGLSILGIDVNLGLLQKNIARDATKALFAGTIYNLPFHSNVFDMVLCLEVLEHLTDPIRALQELARVSKGYCLLSVPDEPYFRAMTFLRGRHIKRLGNHPDHVNNWTKANFLRIIDSHLAVESVKTPFPWVVALCRKI